MRQYVTLKDSRIFRDYSSYQEAVGDAERLASKEHCPFVVCEVIKEIKDTSTENSGNDEHILQQISRSDIDVTALRERILKRWAPHIYDRFNNENTLVTIAVDEFLRVATPVEPCMNPPCVAQEEPSKITSNQLKAAIALVRKEAMLAGYGSGVVFTFSELLNALEQRAASRR